MSKPDKMVSLFNLSVVQLKELFYLDAGLKTNNRILLIDIARFYAIALVFYGYFIEELMLLKNPAAASQYKL